MGIKQEQVDFSPSMWLSLYMERNKAYRNSSAVIGEIRAALARKGVKPNAVASAIGMNRSGIYRRLNGDTPFNLEEIVAIADFLEVPAGSFFPRELVK